MVDDASADRGVGRLRVPLVRAGDGRAPGLVQLCDGERRDVAVGPRFLGGAVDAIDLDLDAVGHLVVTTANVGVVRSTEPVAAALPCRVTGAP